MSVPIIYVKPEDRQVVKQKIEDLLKARDMAIKTQPIIRYNEALNDFLGLQQVRNAEADLAQLLQRPEGQPILKLIQKLENAVKSNMDVKSGRLFISPVLLYELGNALNGRNPEITRALLQPEA